MRGGSAAPARSVAALVAAVALLSALAAGPVSGAPASADAPNASADPPSVGGDAAVPAAPTDAHVLSLSGDGTATNYQFAVSGNLSDAGDTLEPWDDLIDNLASGWVTTPNQVDRYRFTGNVERFATEGGTVRVSVDGRPVDVTPDWRENVTATPVATDARVPPESESDDRTAGESDGRSDRWFAFSVSEGRAMALTGTFSEHNEWTLYGPDGRALQSFRSAEGGDEMSVGAVAPRNGTYYLRVETEIARGPFTVETAAPDEFEPNDDRESAVPIDPGANRTGTIAENDTDWFAVAVDRPGNLTARVGAENAIPYRRLTVDLFDADGERIGVYGDGNRTGYRAVDPDAATARQVARIEENGTYYVRVAGAEEFDGFVRYALDVNASDAPAAEARTLSVIGTGVEASYRFSVSGDLRPTESVDAFDVVDDSSAEGYVTAEGRSDDFRYTGNVTGFEFRRGVAEVRIDGVPVDHADLGNRSR